MDQKVLFGEGPPSGLYRSTNLERSGPFGLLIAKVELSNNREAHEEPVAEAEVVDEQENILHNEVDERHSALSGRSGG